MSITDTELERIFRSWWAESYPTPPGPHALLIGVGFGRHLLDHLQHQQPEGHDAQE